MTEGPKMVPITAIAIPTMPYQTARLALSCPDRPPSDRINRTDAAIYRAVTIFSESMIKFLYLGTSGLAFLEHGQHAARDHKAAHNIDGGNQNRNGGQNIDQPVRRAKLQQGADNNNPRNGIGDRH